MLVTANSNPCFSGGSEFQGPALRDETLCCAQLAAEPVAMLREAHGVNRKSQNMVYRWYRMFCEGRKGAMKKTALDARQHHILTQNLKKLKDMLNSDRPLSVNVQSFSLGSPEKDPKQKETRQEGDQKHFMSSS